jgi:hypothetical protein
VQAAVECHQKGIQILTRAEHAYEPLLEISNTRPRQPNAMLRVRGGILTGHFLEDGYRIEGDRDVVRSAEKLGRGSAVMLPAVAPNLASLGESGLA